MLQYAVIDPQTRRVVRHGMTDEAGLDARKREFPSLLVLPEGESGALGLYHDPETFALRPPTRYDLTMPNAAIVGRPFNPPIPEGATSDPAFPWTPTTVGLQVVTVRRLGYQDHQFFVEVRGAAEQRRMAYPPIEDFADALYWERRGRPEPMQRYLSRLDGVKARFPKGAADGSPD